MEGNVRVIKEREAGLYIMDGLVEEKQSRKGGLTGNDVKSVAWMDIFVSTLFD